MQQRTCARFPIFFLLAAAAASIGCKQEAPYPNHEIEFIIPFAPGGSADTAARIIQPKMSALLGVPVVPVNQSGSAGALGTGRVAKAARDGYQVLATSNSVFTVLPSTPMKLTYHPDDFTPLGSYLSDLIVIAVQGQSPWKNLEQFVDYAKKNPGKLKYGSPGEGTISQFTMEQWKRSSGLEIAPVPFSSSDQVKEALLAGQVAVAASGLSRLVPLFQSGELRPLVITAEDRLSNFPDLPTMYEKGFSEFGLNLWMGLFVPAGTPKEISDKLAGALAQVMQDPAVVDAADRAGLEVNYRNPDATRRLLASEAAMIRAAVEELHVTDK